MLPIITALLGPLMEIIGKFIPDPEARAKAENELRNSLMQWDLSQLEVNKAEAASSSIFVAGWRPFIGWVCGSAFAFHYLAIPIAEIVCQYMNVPIPIINFDMDELMTILLGMLGMGGLRSYEKIKGVAR